MTFVFRCAGCAACVALAGRIGHPPAAPYCVHCDRAFVRVWGSIRCNFGPTATQDAITRYQLTHL